MTCMGYNTLIWWGKIWCWSLLGLKRLVARPWKPYPVKWHNKGVPPPPQKTLYFNNTIQIHVGYKALKVLDIILKSMTKHCHPKHPVILNTGCQNSKWKDFNDMCRMAMQILHFLIYLTFHFRMPVFIQGPALKWEIHEYVSHLHNTFTTFITLQLLLVRV